MKTSKIKYDNRYVTIRKCNCGETPVIRGYSLQSPYEQCVEISCPECGTHNFRVGWCVGGEQK